MAVTNHDFKFVHVNTRGIKTTNDLGRRIDHINEFFCLDLKLEELII